MGFELSIVSWNLHGPPLSPRQSERFAAVAAHLRAPSATAADVICLQEVWSAAQFSILIEALSPSYLPVDVPHNFYPGRQGGLLTFIRRASGWALRNSAFHPFTSSAPAWRLWEGDGMSGKGVQEMHLERGGQQLVVFNTHLQAQYTGHPYPEVRKLQLQQLHERAAAVDQAVPVLAAGDLNTTPDEPLYAQLTGFWQDLTTDLRRQCSCGTTIGARATPKWIDYFLTRRNPRWQVRMEGLARIESQQPDEPYSDHHGLEGRIVVEPALTLGSAAALAHYTLRGPATRRAWLMALATLVFSGRFGGQDDEPS